LNWSRVGDGVIKPVLVQTWKAELAAVRPGMIEPTSAQELFKGRHFDQ
jgi:hypothetical protein